MMRMLAGVVQVHPKERVYVNRINVVD